MLYHLIPLRDVVIYPGIVTPLFVGRDKSIKSIDASSKDNMQIVLVSQKSANIDDPKVDDVYDVATLADIIQIIKLPDGTLKLLVEGRGRVKVNSYVNNDLAMCDVSDLNDNVDYDEEETFSVREMIIKSFGRYLKARQKHPKEVLQSLKEIGSLSHLCDAVSSHTSLSIEKKISLLVETDVKERIAKLLTFLESELDVINLEQSIRSRVKTQMDKNQKEYYLNEQSKAIQKELESLDESKTDFGRIESQIKACKMPSSVEEKCLSELEKMKKMSSLSSEGAVLRNYLETMIDYPWSNLSNINSDVIEAKSILEGSHYGLEDVKERIVEYIAVQKRTKKVSGSILCLVGPPGVGKTSIGKSIAEAVNRKYVRIALGGVRDEAEIRGHRRTYIGAIPGRIVQNITKSKVSNPLFLLDEIDKMGMDHRGDPASAMLEVLDPEQNNTFNDHYMEVDIDLSNVLFIATANSLDIPSALLDRMEIVRIPGYTEGEKINIAKKHLISKNLLKNGLGPSEINITDKALSMIVENYTREAGVRQLDREIDKVFRKAVTKMSLSKSNDRISISQKNLSSFLGVKKYVRDNLNNIESIGRINGLAWTSVGGEILNIEVAILPGKGKISLTGKLGDVMQESVQAAMTVVKSYVGNIGVSYKFFQEHDFHIHLPEAATPKDGPSAGIAITTALLSAIMQIPVSHKIAMTGEITIQGSVLPIGGLKEKLFAAVRENISKVFIPLRNEKDLSDISDEIKNKLAIVTVSDIQDVLLIVFPKLLNSVKKEPYSLSLVDGYLQRDHLMQQKH